MHVHFRKKRASRPLDNRVSNAHGMHFQKGKKSPFFKNEILPYLNAATSAMKNGSKLQISLLPSRTITNPFIRVYSPVSFDFLQVRRSRIKILRKEYQWSNKSTFFHVWSWVTCRIRGNCWGWPHHQTLAWPFAVTVEDRCYVSDFCPRLLSNSNLKSIH